MATPALAGIAGLYLSQFRKNGLLGMIGYVPLSLSYLSIVGTEIVSAYVLPTLTATNPGYVQDVIAASTGGLGYSLWRTTFSARQPVAVGQ